MREHGHDSLSPLRWRARLNRCVRGFFEEAGFVEVETPLLAARLIPEPSIGIFATKQHDADGSTRTLYLTPSPELWMKRLVAAGMPRVYQMARCFRNVEGEGPFHHREFTMLEWYAVDEDYTEALDRMERLLTALRAEIVAGSGPGPAASTAPPVRRVAMARLWQDAVGVDPAVASGAELAALARRLEIPAGAADTWEQLFNRIFLTRVEPRIAKHHPVAVLDYPAGIPTLAANASDGVHAQRWELYLGGDRGGQLLPGRDRPRDARRAAGERGAEPAHRSGSASPGPGAGGGVWLRRLVLGRGRRDRPAVRPPARPARDRAGDRVCRPRLTRPSPPDFWSPRSYRCQHFGGLPDPAD